MKRRFVVPFVAALFLVVPPLHADQVMARIGQYKIYHQQLDDAVHASVFAPRYFLVGTGEKGQIRGKMLKQMINDELIYRQALAEGLDKSKIYQKNLKRGKAAGNSTNPERRVLIDTFLAQKRKEWRTNDAMLRAYLMQNPDLEFEADSRRLAQIVVEELSEAEQILRRLEKGEDFADLAREFSIDPYGRRNGGDMGWIEVGSGMPEIEKALEKTKKGKTSGIIKASDGFHIVQVIDFRKGSEKAFSEIRDRLTEIHQENMMRSYTKSLRTKYPVEWSFRVSR